MNGRLLNVNGFEMWANVREFDDGLRLRLTLPDWQRLNLADDQRVQVGVHGEILRVAPSCRSANASPMRRARLSNRVERIPE